MGGVLGEGGTFPSRILGKTASQNGSAEKINREGTTLNGPFGGNWQMTP